MFAPLYRLPEPRVIHGVVITQDFDRPLCCDAPMAIHPPRVAMDAYEPFGEFTTQVQQPDGTFKDITIDSLAKLRAVERDSERRAANGEGTRMVWRDYSQDRSNFDVHTLGPDPSVKITPELRARMRPIERVSQAEAEATALGPGVSDATVSPLGE